MNYADDAGNDSSQRQDIIDDFIPLGCLNKLTIMNNVILEVVVAAMRGEEFHIKCDIQEDDDEYKICYDSESSNDNEDENQNENANKNVNKILNKNMPESEDDRNYKNKQGSKSSGIAENMNNRLVEDENICENEANRAEKERKKVIEINRRKYEKLVAEEKRKDEVRKVIEKEEKRVKECEERKRKEDEELKIARNKEKKERVQREKKLKLNTNANRGSIDDHIEDVDTNEEEIKETRSEVDMIKGTGMLKKINKVIRKDMKEEDVKKIKKAVTSRIFLLVLFFFALLLFTPFRLLDFVYNESNFFPYPFALNSVQPDLQHAAVNIP